MIKPHDENNPLALHRPFIVGSTDLSTPEHYDGGIPVRALEGDLQIIFNPWLVMSIGDELKCFWGNLSTPVRSIIIEDENQVGERVVITIPQGFVIDGDAQMFYSVTRVGQAEESYQPVLTMLVKTTRPGGFDDSPEEGHSGLNYTLIPDLSNGVDPGMAERGIQMRIEPYENMATFDCIICRWGSQQVTYYPVTQQQIDDPANHPIIVTFDKATIEKHGDGANVPVTYQVIDRVGNYPDERAPWAKITRVLVDLKGNRLNAALVLVDGKPVSTIDLAKLGDINVIVWIYTPENDFAVGDKVVMTWTGTAPNGQPIIVGPLEQTVEYVPFHCDFVIPNASVKAIAKGWASVGYILQRAGVADRPSKNTSVTVEGQINHLAAPSVVEAPGGILDPDEPWATAKIAAYPGRKGSDQLTLIMEARHPNGTIVYYDDSRPVGNVPENEPILRSVSNAVIRRFTGLRVKVFYRVANDDAVLLDVRDSQVFYMQVGVSLPQFERPHVEEAGQDGTLDPDHVPPTGATLVVPHTNTILGDCVTYRWRGSTTDGSTSDFIELTSHTVGKPVKFTVPKTYVINNLNGTVMASYTLQRNGQMMGTSAELKLNIGKPQAELPPPEVVEAPDLILDPNQHQHGFTVRFNSAEVPPGSEIELTITGRPADGSTTPQRKPVNGQQRVDFNIAPAITGANLKRSVLIEYKVLNTRAPTPAQTLELRIGELLQRSMPKPLLEGFSGEVLQMSLITNATKVLCDKWPFQRSGLPIWLSYKEQRTDGTSRSKDQFVGTAHDQGAGLSYTAEVAWLRECKADSTVAIVLKVGFFREAMVSDAVECEARVYTVKAGLDELSTFTGYDWHRWTLIENFPKAEICEEEGEFFVQSIPSSSSPPSYYVALKKTFEVDSGEPYIFSFDYQCAVDVNALITQPYQIYKDILPATTKWQSRSSIFLAAFSQIIVYVYIGHTIDNVIKVDNLRIRKY
ncbi:hypothetical protein ICA16_07280 [Pseudomonas anatoliensis]|uniref:hypothetical protein n=1 Tax=Pseudomonas anatoliensis TaxID=2710589 RepID=UPI001B32987E|nr:hypothetical protein [Pseudomonas anatoliensis]MBP5955463.1 hypothetical protein [Pseudomonas anatoliensis]